MSFLDKEEPKQSSVWDWIIGIGLILLIGAFTLYYQYEKKESGSRFEEANALFEAGRFKDAAGVYEELKSAQYLTPNDDSVIYQRLDSIQSLEEQEMAALERIRSFLAVGDTLSARNEKAAFPFRGFLSAEDQVWLGSFN